MKIVEARRKVGLTQKQIANSVGIAEVSYKRYEYGNRVPDARTAIRIAKALNTTVETLWDGNPTT